MILRMGRHPETNFLVLHRTTIMVLIIITTYTKTISTAMNFQCTMVMPAPGVGALHGTLGLTVVRTTTLAPDDAVAWASARTLVVCAVAVMRASSPGREALACMVITVTVTAEVDTISDMGPAARVTTETSTLISITPLPLPKPILARLGYNVGRQERRARRVDLRGVADGGISQSSPLPAFHSAHGDSWPFHSALVLF